MLLDLVKYVRECQEDLKHVNSQFRHLKEVPTAALIKGVTCYSCVNFYRFLLILKSTLLILLELFAIT